MKSSAKPHIQDNESNMTARRATRAEIDAAFHNLTDVENAKLLHTARVLAYGFWQDEEEDLLQTAIMQIYSGSRPWYIEKRDDIFWHLHETLINIAWKRRNKLQIKDPRTGESIRRLIDPQLTDGTEIWDGIADPEVDTEKSYEAVEQINLLFKELKDHPKAIKVLNEWMDGYTGPEVRQRLDLTKTEYGTIERRINRAIDRLIESFGRCK